MRARFTLVAFLLALALLGLYCAGSGRRGSSVRDAARGRVELAAVPVAASESATPAELPAAQRVAALGPEGETAAPPPESPRAGHRLRGVLLRGRDRTPAAGAALVFWFGDESVEVVTGADGRFETDAPVPPGSVRVYHRGDVPDPVQTEHLEIEPEIVLLPDPGADGEFAEVELVLMDPAAWLEIEVVGVNGVPTAAELRWLFRAAGGGGRLWRAPTGADGRARLPFPSAEPGAELQVFARAAGGLVSDILVIEAPLSDERARLVLDAGGSIRARALDAHGAPLANERLMLEAAAAVHRLADDSATTDAGGFALFTSVAPGRHAVRSWCEEQSVWVRAEADVERGRTAEVELCAPSQPLAVVGRVLDPDGLPVARVTIVARVERRSTTTATDEHGVFSIGSPARGTVRVAPAPDLDTDRYEPAALEVPFGTRDVVFRQSETRAPTRLTLEILERGTLARIPDTMVLGFLEPERSDWSFHPAQQGLVTLELKLYDDVGLAIEAVGYRRRLVNAAELARGVPAGAACRVVLEPGLERALQVLDEEEGTPLVGARVLDGERLVATTDGDGRAAIDLGGWPVELRVEAAGHAPGTWKCKDWLAELGDGAVWLERASHDATQPAQR